MSLPIYVTQDKWQDFDDAWSDLMASSEPLDELFVALRRAGEKNRIVRCLPLVKQHVEILETTERFADAANLVGTTIQAGGAGNDLADTLMRLATAAWGNEPDWQQTIELTGLGDEGKLRKSWGSFIKLQKFQVGILVFHPTGWGTGEIFDVTDNGMTLHIRFQNGREDFFPLAAALDIFDPLDDTDLRARSFRDEEGLKKEVKKDPLDALRAILIRYHGRATTNGIKNAMAQIGVEGSAFSAWWRKTKPLAENSEWFRLTGSGKKIEVHLLLTAADPQEQLKRQLNHAASLEDVITKGRDLLIKKQIEPELAVTVYEALREGAASEEADQAQRLSAWVLMREATGEIPEPLQLLIEDALIEDVPEDDANHVPALWAMFQMLPTTHDQEQAIQILIEVYGEGWVDQAITNLEHAAPGMVRGLVDRMLTAKRENDLGDVYRRLLTRTTRSPHLLLSLAKYAEADKLGGELPPTMARAQAYINLATYLFENRRVDAAFGRAHTRMVDFMAGGSKPILAKLLDDAKLTEVRSIQRLAHRGVEESIDNQLINLATHAEDDTGMAGTKYFWHNDSIWTTRSGKELLARELKELKDVKMPANEEAIGRAAALGDLSENSEWESAIEEKRNLSSRASSMEEDLSRTELLENAILPEGVVSPGTAVRYMDKSAGTENSITLLGPWDSKRGEDVVSYRAPLAQGLLGLHTGDARTIELPGGLIDVEVLEITPVAVD